MQYEKTVKKTKSYGLNISANKVDSLRISENLETVVRIYSGGKIGVAGTVGPCNEYSLLEEAKAKLAQGIPYPCNLTACIHRNEGEDGGVIEGKNVLPVCSSLVNALSARFPDFIFSNKFNCEQVDYSYVNTLDTQYNYKSSNITLALTIKAKSSANIMDLMYVAVNKYYNENRIVEDIAALLDVYDNKLDIPQDVPVLIPAEVIEFIIPHLVAEKYVAGSSIFNGNLGFKVFNDSVNIGVDRSPDNRDNIPFFDCEGTVVPEDKYLLIKNGVLGGLITYKRSAENLRLPLSGSASADFDSVPSYGTEGIKIYSTAPHLRSLLRGKAVYIAVTSGGDMTPGGDIGLPVLLAYVYENGRLKGTLPEFSLSCNIFDLLGKDFIGVAKNDVFRFAEETLIVSKAKIIK